VITRRGFTGRLIGTLGLGALSGGYALAFEPLYRLNTTHYALTPPGWRPGHRLRIVALADFHFCRPWMNEARAEEIVARANALMPDITLLLGDYLPSIRFRGRDLANAHWAGILGNLKAPLGVHAILGNHDWWEDTGAMRRHSGPTEAGEALKNAGIRVYENDVLRLEKDGQAFWLAGLGDQIAFLERWQAGHPVARGVDDLPGTLAKITTDDPVLMMAHEPDAFARMPARVSLTLSGHTHGGQIRLLGFSPIVPSRYGRRYAYGHVVQEGRHLIVSGGLGCSRIPVRIGIPPEVVVIDLGGEAPGA
jgi:uncharacterized protein